MKKAYVIHTSYANGQKHMVVAENIAEAEKTYLKEYGWTIKIKSIELESEYVLIAEVEK